jgi:hypothetical protein
MTVITILAGLVLGAFFLPEITYVAVMFMSFMLVLLVVPRELYTKILIKSRTFLKEFLLFLEVYDVPLTSTLPCILVASKSIVPCSINVILKACNRLITTNPRNEVEEVTSRSGVPLLRTIHKLDFRELDIVVLPNSHRKGGRVGLNSVLLTSDNVCSGDVHVSVTCCSEGIIPEI